MKAISLTIQRLCPILKFFLDKETGQKLYTPYKVMISFIVYHEAEVEAPPFLITDRSNDLSELSANFLSTRGTSR